MKIDISVTGTESSTVRARQLASMFDKPPQAKQDRQWAIDVPLEDHEWTIGAIVGPSGSGKTTILSEFGRPDTLTWDNNSVIDSFRDDLTMADIADACSAVGFNTIPAWLRPHSTLSNGEQFRATLARLIAEAQPGDTVIIDEYTSVVDRQVAKIASAALSKYARRKQVQVIVATCHYDVIDWLQPDWLIQPDIETFTWRKTGDRPKLTALSARATTRYGSALLHTTI